MIHRQQLSIYKRNRTLLETLNLPRGLYNPTIVSFTYIRFLHLPILHFVFEVRKLWILKGFSTTTMLSVLQVYVVRCSWLFICTRHFILVYTSHLIVFIKYIQALIAMLCWCPKKKPFKQTKTNIASSSFIVLLWSTKPFIPTVWINELSSDYICGSFSGSGLIIVFSCMCF